MQPHSVMMMDNQLQMPQHLQGQVSNSMLRPDEIKAELFGQVYQPDQQILRITSRESQIAFCPRCVRNVQTKVEYHVGTGAVIAGAFVALMGGTAGCCLIPCFIRDCKDAVHFCSTCNQKIGRRRFIVK